MIDRRGWRTTLGMAILFGGAAIALSSEFFLDGWASISQLGDWIQHGVIFWGAVGVGASLVVLRRPRHLRGDGAPAPRASGGRQAGLQRVSWGVAIGCALLVGGGSVSLLSQFYLDYLASVSVAWDAVQHGIIFLGGVGLGASIVLLRRVGHGRRKDATSKPAASETDSPLRAGRLLAAGLLCLLAAGYLTGLAYLDLQGGLSIPSPLDRIDAIHVAAGVGAVVFALCLILRLHGPRISWSRWMTGLFVVAAVLYAGVVVTGVILLFPLPADLADDLTHAHLIAAVWAAEPTIALLVELGLRGELRALRPPSELVHRGRRALSRRSRGVALGGLLGLAALVPAIVLAVIAPRAISPSAQRGGYESWQPIGPGVIMDAATLQPGSQTVIAGGYGLYAVHLDGTWHPIGNFAGQDVLSLLRAPDGTVYLGTGAGLYRAPSFSGPYQRLPFPSGGVHGIAVKGSEIWASAAFRGFYVSVDGGARWRLVNAGLQDPDLAWAVVDDNGTVFGSDVYGVYRFTGNHWDRVSDEEGVFTFTQGSNGQLFAAGEGGGVWVRKPNGQWGESDTGLLSHNQGSFRGIHEFSVTAAGGDRLYGGSMDTGGDVSLDQGATWSQQWPNLARVGAVYRILPDGRDLIAATDAGILLYRLPDTAPAGPLWWAVLIGATLAVSLLSAAAGLSRRRGSAGPSDRSARHGLPEGGSQPAREPAETVGHLIAGRGNPAPR